MTKSSSADGKSAAENQEEALCNQFAAMPSPSRTSHQKKSAGEDGKSLGKCIDDNTTSLHDMKQFLHYLRKEKRALHIYSSNGHE